MDATSFNAIKTEKSSKNIANRQNKTAKPRSFHENNKKSGKAQQKILLSHSELSKLPSERKTATISGRNWLDTKSPYFGEM